MGWLMQAFSIKINKGSMFVCLVCGISDTHQEGDQEPYSLMCKRCAPLPACSCMCSRLSSLYVWARQCVSERVTPPVCPGPSIPNCVSVSSICAPVLRHVCTLVILQTCAMGSICPACMCACFRELVSEWVGGWKSAGEHAE